MRFTLKRSTVETTLTLFLVTFYVFGATAIVRLLHKGEWIDARTVFWLLLGFSIVSISALLVKAWYVIPRLDRSRVTDVRSISVLFFGMSAAILIAFLRLADQWGFKISTTPDMFTYTAILYSFSAILAFLGCFLPFAFALLFPSRRNLAGREVREYSFGEAYSDIFLAILFVGMTMGFVSGLDPAASLARRGLVFLFLYFGCQGMEFIETFFVNERPKPWRHIFVTAVGAAWFIFTGV